MSGSHRQRLYRTAAVILGRHDLGEADRILTLLTPGQGKLRAVARGIRRISSRKAGHLELLTHANLLLARGRTLDVITQAETVRSFPGLRVELERAGRAYYIAELAQAFAQEGQPGPGLFDLFLDTLEEVESGEQPALAVRYFELHLLTLGGYRPEVFLCASCGRPLEEREALYSLADGGVICPRCPRPRSHTRPLSARALKAMRFLLQQSWEGASRLRLSPALEGELERHLQAALAYILERDLKSRRFLERLRREQAREEPVPAGSRPPPEEPYGSPPPGDAHGQPPPEQP